MRRHFLSQAFAQRRKILRASWAHSNTNDHTYGNAHRDGDADTNHNTEAYSNPQATSDASAKTLGLKPNVQ